MSQLEAQLEVASASKRRERKLEEEVASLQKDLDEQKVPAGQARYNSTSYSTIFLGLTGRETRLPPSFHIRAQRSEGETGRGGGGKRAKSEQD